MQLTLPLCVRFLIKFPVMLPAFPPTSLIRQLIKSRIVFTRGCPKAVVACLDYVNKKPFRGAKAKHGVELKTGHTYEDMVPLWRVQL